jgi:hypothetical protein
MLCHQVDILASPHKKDEAPAYRYVGASAPKERGGKPRVRACLYASTLGDHNRFPRCVSPLAVNIQDLVRELAPLGMRRALEEGDWREDFTTLAATGNYYRYE